MTNKLIEKLSKNKEYRGAFVASQVNIGIPFQIRALRKQQDRNWDQKKLAEEAGMLQPRISAMEKPGYGSFTLETLMRLASAFDVALIVRFAPFSDLIRWSDKFSPDSFQIPSFEKERENVATSTGNVYAFNYLMVTNTNPATPTPLNNNAISNRYTQEEIKSDTSSVVHTGEVISGIQKVSAGG